MGEFAGIGLFTLALAMWAAVPLFDTRTAPGRRGRQTTVFGLLILIALIALTIIGYVEVL